jgi:hypothetical protein
MALRILSGMVYIPRGGTRSGSVVIGFDPLALTSSSDPVYELRKRIEVGPRGRFKAKPASIVATRQFGLLDTGSYYRINLDNTVTRDSVTIAWKARGSGRVDQEEIGFMIAGEVPDGPATLPPGPSTRVPPTKRFPSKISAAKRARKRPAASS